MALSAPSLAAFEGELFRWLSGVIGCDTACSVWSGEDGAARHATALGYDEAALMLNMPRYMGELASEELCAFAAARPAIDRDVLTERRRAHLTVYAEFLLPAGVSTFVTNVWQSRFGVFGFHFGRAGARARFRARDVDRLASLVPALKLAEAFFASGACGIPGALGAAEWWAAAWSLSSRERDVVRLVARGFQNAEIAALLRISPNTVRNHLVAVFRKAGVSTRTELVYDMTLPATRTQERSRPRGAVSRSWIAGLAAAR